MDNAVFKTAFLMFLFICGILFADITAKQARGLSCKQLTAEEKIEEIKNTLPNEPFKSRSNIFTGTIISEEMSDNYLAQKTEVTRILRGDTALKEWIYYPVSDNWGTGCQNPGDVGDEVVIVVQPEKILADENEKQEVWGTYDVNSQAGKYLLENIRRSDTVPQIPTSRVEKYTKLLLDKIWNFILRWPEV